MANMKALYEKNRNDPSLEAYAQMLYDLAIIAEGGKIDNASRFSRQVGDFMAKAMA
jgi:molecular chaperone HtpG